MPHQTCHKLASDSESSEDDFVSRAVELQKQKHSTASSLNSQPKLSKKDKKKFASVSKNDQIELPLQTKLTLDESHTQSDTQNIISPQKDESDERENDSFDSSVYSTPIEASAGYRGLHFIRLLPEQHATKDEFFPVYEYSYLSKYNVNSSFIDYLSKKFKTPTPIQSQCWPIILSGYDCLGIAETGSGKSIAMKLFDTFMF